MTKKDVSLYHSTKDSYKKKLRSAKQIIDEALETIKNPYMSLSGGKDSTVVYGLLRRLQPDIPAVWSDDEWWLPETMVLMEMQRKKFRYEKV